jgi:hypothetical protein
MERLERNTTAVEEQVSRLRSHLLGAAAVLRDRSRNLLSGNHAKRLRRLAALIEAATPGLAILVGLPESRRHGMRCAWPAGSRGNVTRRAGDA